MRYIYLHGFASGPLSRKAQTFKNALRASGNTLEIPDLAQSDFEHLTLSGQLNVIGRLLGGEPACLTGSSMGGYLAALYASSHPEIERLVLLAPAFDFASRWREMMGPEKLANWEQTGLTEVFHYGENALRSLRYGLYEDALRFPAYPAVIQPTRIFHGIHDDVVPIAFSRHFAHQSPNVQLTEVDSDHELLSELDAITRDAVDFLTGPLTGVQT